LKLRTALVLSAIALIAGLLPSAATAAPLWSSVPSPFTCGPGNTIVPSNACLSRTGFNPNTRYWGQWNNSKGNCTNYVAFRLQRNGAAQLASSFGNAVGWRSVVQQKLGSKAANGTPKVGAIAWWGAFGAPGVYGAGHVAYVEKVASGGDAIYLSESHWNRGSRRLIVKRGDAYWPDSFLHVKDQPAPKKTRKTAPPSTPSEDPPSEEEEVPSGDESAPSSPASLKASGKTTSSISLSWSASSDDIGVAGYSVYRNGTRIANTSATTYKVSGLSCGTSYKLGVDAYDGAGNRSSAAGLTASTSACPKTVKLSKGSSVNVAGCKSSACAYMQVSLSGFGSGSHTVTCYADYPPPTGSFYTYNTSATTSNVCVYGYAGTHVWVKVDGVESNHLTW
jgi:surface antigen